MRLRGASFRRWSMSTAEHERVSPAASRQDMQLTVSYDLCGMDLHVPLPSVSNRLNASFNSSSCSASSFGAIGFLRPAGPACGPPASLPLRLSADAPRPEDAFEAPAAALCNRNLPHNNVRHALLSAGRAVMDETKNKVPAGSSLSFRTWTEGRQPRHEIAMWLTIFATITKQHTIQDSELYALQIGTSDITRHRAQIIFKFGNCTASPCCQLPGDGVW